MKNKMLTLALLSSFISLNIHAADGKKNESLDDLFDSFIASPSKTATSQGLFASSIVDTTKKPGDASASSSSSAASATPKKPVVNPLVSKNQELEEQIRQLKAGGDTSKLQTQLKETEQRQAEVEAKLKKAEEEKTKALEAQKASLERKINEELRKQEENLKRAHNQAIIDQQSKFESEAKAALKKKEKELTDAHEREIETLKLDAAQHEKDELAAQKLLLEKEKTDAVAQKQKEVVETAKTRLTVLQNQRDLVMGIYLHLAKITAGFVSGQKPADINNDDLQALLAGQTLEITLADSTTVEESVELPREFLELMAKLSTGTK